MKACVLVAVIALIHGSYATLLIRGPTEPVLEGQMITLECLLSDSDLNISQVHFEYFSKYMQSWQPVSRRYFCYDRMETEQVGDSLWLLIPHAGRYYEGPYRCVSDADNVTGADNSSLPYSFKVNYMGELSVTRKGRSSYLWVPQELSVRAGDDVVLKCSASSSEEPNYFWHKEGSDWILPSSTLTLSKITEESGGRYTCAAEHSVESLNKKRTVSITVLPKDAPWYKTSDGRLMLMTSAAASALVVFVLTLSVFLCRRAKRSKRGKNGKRPIDDRSQVKPIYRSSAESLPSTCGDKQPLV